MKSIDEKKEVPTSSVGNTLNREPTEDARNTNIMHL